MLVGMTARRGYFVEDTDITKEQLAALPQLMAERLQEQTLQEPEHPWQRVVALKDIPALGPFQYEHFNHLVMPKPTTRTSCDLLCSCGKLLCVSFVATLTQEEPLDFGTLGPPVGSAGSLKPG